jgi:hypothetical protein
MKVVFTKYNEPKNNDTCIVVCFFSPVNFQKPINNINCVLNQLDNSKINYTLVELLYPGQTQRLKNSIVVKSNTIIFSKENLWNIGEKYTRDKFSKLIFLDSDILFDIPDWIDISSNMLDNNDIIQCMEYAYKGIELSDIDGRQIDVDISDRNITKEPVAKAIKLKQNIVLGRDQPGFAIGIKRDFFHKIGGFFEYGITGCSDVLFWLSMIDFHTYEVLRYIESVEAAKIKYLEYKHNMRKYFDQNRVDYIEDCVGLHLQHGKECNRFYQNRNIYLPENISFYHNNDGVLEINSNDNKDLRQYWIDRKEDE